MRFRPTRPRAELATVEESPHIVDVAPPLTPFDRRARARDRAWWLMPTSIPTREILDSYLDDVLLVP